MTTNSAIKGRLLILVTTWLGLKGIMGGRGSLQGYILYLFHLCSILKMTKPEMDHKLAAAPGQGRGECTWLDWVRGEFLVMMERLCMGIAMGVA